MSLFGDFDGPPSSRAKSSLFDDVDADDRNQTTHSSTAQTRVTSSTTASSSIFADGATGSDDSSPWGFTPRKNVGRGSLVKSLLADVEVPELYVDEFDRLQVAGSVGAQEVQLLLKDGHVAAPDQKKIWSVFTTGDTSSIRFGRGEFSVLLALIGLAQEGEDLGLDAVDERRHRLPVPSIQQASSAGRAAPAKAPENVMAHSSQHSTEAPAAPSSFGTGFESDPWGSPALHKNHRHANGNGGPQRTTSNITTSAVDPSDAPGGNGFEGSRTAAASESSSWGGNAFNGAPSEAGGAHGGFGEEGEGSHIPPRRPVQPQRISTGKGAEEVVTVNLLDEKEGMFMFQHRNYEIASIRRNSRVIRRYSDFVWLLDCLHKRYPFRQLPLLPPKRVQINGNHLAADGGFLEKRRRGLARFSNALVRHPILREEQLVVMFLTVPTELTVWRKQATISVQEEFVGKHLPPTLEDSLPQNLLETFDTVRSGVRRSSDLYINLCTIVERLCKRKEAIAGEYGRLHLNLNSVIETNSNTFAIDTNDVPLLNEGIKGTSKHVSASQALLDDEARAWDQGVLEDFKAIRDSLVSLRDMFDRRDRLARDNIPQLERRIQQSEIKLQTIKAKGDAAKPGEAEKVENAIVADKQSIVDQHARGVFIKECVRDELLYFQAVQYRVSRLHQDWAQERVKYAELQADNFRGLVDAVESMPLGD